MVATHQGHLGSPWPSDRDVGVAQHWGGIMNKHSAGNQEYVNECAHT